MAHSFCQIIRDHRRGPTPLLIMHVIPAFLEQPTPFPHNPLVHCAFTKHFSNLPVNFRQTNIFSVAEFAMFLSTYRRLLMFTESARITCAFVSYVLNARRSYRHLGAALSPVPEYGDSSPLRNVGTYYLSNYKVSQLSYLSL